MVDCMTESNEDVWGCLDGVKFNNRTLKTKVENNIHLKEHQKIYDIVVDGMIDEMILDIIQQKLKEVDDEPV